VKPNSIIILTKPQYVRSVLVFFKFFINNNFSSLMDVWGADYPYRDYRFEVNFLVLNFSTSYRVIIRICTNEYLPVPTVSDIYSSAS